MVTSPIIADVDKYYQEWKSKGGSKQAFYRFMTSPSVNRDRYVNSMRPDVSFLGSTITVTLA